MDDGSTNSQELDASGKANFDSIYTADTPLPYLNVMRQLDYRIPTEAQAYIEHLVSRYSAAHPNQQEVHVLDIGTSYGINGALLKWNLSLVDFCDHYLTDGYSDLPLAQRDLHNQQLCLGRSPRSNIKVIGLDISKPALDFGLETGLLDHSVCVDLEKHSADDTQAEQIKQSDCLISTGCLGYVSEVSLRKIIELCAPNKPWMAHCLLRMFPLEPYRKLFESYGYRVWLSDEILPQRRFASAEEKEQVLDSLHQQGIDTTGYESGDYLWARVFYVVPDDLPDESWKFSVGLKNEQ